MRPLETAISNFAAACANEGLSVAVATRHHGDKADVIVVDGVDASTGPIARALRQDLAIQTNRLSFGVPTALATPFQAAGLDTSVLNDGYEVTSAGKGPRALDRAGLAKLGVRCQ